MKRDLDRFKWHLDNLDRHLDNFDIVHLDELNWPQTALKSGLGKEMGNEFLFDMFNETQTAPSDDT